MSITLHFNPPTVYNVDQWILGEAFTENDALSGVASGTDVGVYPTYINSIEYPAGDPTYYYAVMFKTTDNFYSSWTTMAYGREATDFGFFIYIPTDSKTVYLIPPPISGQNPNWLAYNGEYTITVHCSGLYGVNTTYMASDYSFTFLTVVNPLWSTVTAVRLAVGPIIEAIPDATIIRMIYKMSIKAIDMFLEGINNYGYTWDVIPEPLFRWVTCSAGMLALNAAVAAGTTIGGSSLKKLGAMTVSYDSGNLDSPGEIRKQLSECVKEASDMIGALLRTRVQAAIKSIDNSYITHPLRDTAWGRIPRMVLGGESIGPWYYSHEYGEYSRDDF